MPCPSTVRPRVLVVDDAAEVRLLVRGILESEDFLVQTAENGKEAIRCLSQASADLILLDLDLPDIQGTELCRRWRHEGNPIPIVILTSHNSEGERVAGLECGADDYLGKPFLPEELLARIRAHLRRQATNQEMTQQMLRSQWQHIEAGFRLTQGNQRPGDGSRIPSAVHHTPVGRIGGDFFLLEDLPHGRTGVMVADAMGKGLSACLVMSSAMSHSHDLLQAGLSPGSILNELNRRLGPGLAEMGTFVAMFCGILDEHARTFQYSSAGLEAPIWLRPGGRGRRHARLTTEGVPIGVLPEFPYDERSLVTAPGDQIFVYSDGLSEAVPVDQQPRLMRLLYRILLRPDWTVQDKVSAILHHLRPAERSLRDDVTFLLLECPP